MNRGQYIESVFNTLVTLTLIILMLNSCATEKRKNIIFIMADDHAFQAISSYGGNLNKTPNIDRLANEGIRFEQSFVTNSICGPSRAVMLTGKYSHLNGMIDNSTTFDGSQQTFPKILQKHGYLTALIGKWHLRSSPTGFDYWNILPGQGNYYNPDFIEMGKKKRVKGYVTDLTTNFALNWLDNRDKSKPFCLLIHQKAPHRNWMPSPNYLNKYDDVEFPLPETFYDDYKNRGSAAKEQAMEVDHDLLIDYDLKVPINKSERNEFKNEKIGGSRWSRIYDRMDNKQKKEWDKAYTKKNQKFKNSNLSGKDLAKWKYQRYIKDYLRCISSVDDNVGKVLDYLKANNLTENTVIIYTSDQGFYLGEHGWFDKRFMYEQSLRTPLIISDPNGKKGIFNKTDMVMNIDYAPTILNYAGIEMPTDMQGKSLLNIVEGETPQNWRKSVYYHYFEYPAEHGVKRHYGIRTSRYKLIHFYYDIDEWELYDLEKDPNEMNNIYKHPEYKQKIEILKNELQGLRTKYKETDLKEFLPKKNVHVTHKGIGAKVTFEYKYDPKYNGGSRDALMDGLRGPDRMVSHVDFSIWQGFEKNDLSATIDLKNQLDITKISAGFLQDLESWIFLPDWVEIEYSKDNRNYHSLGKVERKSKINDTNNIREDYIFSFNKINARYLKVHAKNVGTCPNWHQGDGGPAWIFADEIIVE